MPPICTTYLSTQTSLSAASGRLHLRSMHVIEFGSDAPPLPSVPSLTPSPSLAPKHSLARCASPRFADPLVAARAGGPASVVPQPPSHAITRAHTHRTRIIPAGAMYRRSEFSRPRCSDPLTRTDLHTTSHAQAPNQSGIELTLPLP